MIFDISIPPAGTILFPGSVSAGRGKGPSSGSPARACKQIGVPGGARRGGFLTR